MVMLTIMFVSTAKSGTDMSSNYRGKVPRAVGEGEGCVGGDKDRRIDAGPDASMYNRYAQGKTARMPTLSDADLKRVEEIHEMPDEKPVYINVKARYE